MKLKNQQKGGIIGTLMMFILAGFILIYGVQIAFAYISQQTIKGAVRSALVEMKVDSENATPGKVKDNILKKISVNDLSIDKENIYVTRDGRYFVVNVDYNKEIGISNQAKIVLDLSFEERTP